MAQLQSTSITGSFNLALATANSGSAGNIFIGINNRLQYTFAGYVWTAGGAMITARCALAGAGTNTAALAFGGSNPSFGAVLSCTETYNGTSWSAGGALSTARQQLAGAGTNTAALAFGGYATPGLVACTETYNGSTWSAGGALSAARNLLAGAGTNTAALAFGGSLDGFSGVACTETYACVCFGPYIWSAGGAMNTARNLLAGAGTNTAALAFGGGTPTATACTETYNGTAWSLGGAMITARSCLAGAGTNTAALAFGGATPTIVACTELAVPGTLVCCL